MRPILNAAVWRGGCFLLLWIAGSSCCLAAEFRAGVAVTDITPPKGYRMSGYFNERLNTGVKDPLHAKALVFRQANTQAALVVCDLIGMTAEVTTRARRLASERTGIPPENIVITATHSHTGPLYFSGLREYFHERAVKQHGRDPQEESPYGETLVEKLVEVIAKAHAAAVPVRIDAGIAQEDRLSFNRRFHMKDGSVRFNPGQQNPNIVRVAGPIDPDVGIIRVRATARAPRASSAEPSPESDTSKDLACLVVFAMHLDTTGGTEYSADYPFFLERELRKSLGPDFVSIFGTGTCGDINHVDVRIKGRRSTEEMGTMLAETVAGHLPELAAVENPSLAVRRAVVDAPLQKHSAEQVAAARERMAKIGSRELSFLEQVETAKIFDLSLRKSDTLPLEVQAFRLSADVAIVTLPAEVFVELGLAIKRASPFKTTLVIELANDDPAYIPTKKAFAEGSYETVNSRVVPGSGERMVEAAAKLLKELAE
ncbi:MAG: neutral/alkaline non-lysosomal ceramidase N-terminal domain-containing protein [Pirellulales bacterium]